MPWDFGPRERKGEPPVALGRRQGGGHRSWGAHLHLGEEQQLLSDAQENRVESQLVRLLVQPRQGRPGRRQQVVLTGPFFLGHGRQEAVCWALNPSKVIS